MELEREVVARKRAEASLQSRAMSYKEQGVRVKETNAALKVLLQQRDADRAELEEKVPLNVNKRIMPYLDQSERAKTGCKAKGVCRDPGIQPERDRLAARAQSLLQNVAAFAYRA